MPITPTMNITTKAEEFARYAHRNHVRNDRKKTPYIFHLKEVTGIVRNSGGSDQEIAAAWLHDSVEDTDTTLEIIEKEFGSGVASIVEGLTDLPEWTSLSLGERKAAQAKRIAGESTSVKRVKLADQASNVSIIGRRESDFDTDTSLLYITSAKKISLACAGISEYLDTLFDKRYQTAYKNLTSQEPTSTT